MNNFLKAGFIGSLFLFSQLCIADSQNNLRNEEERNRDIKPNAPYREFIAVETDSLILRIDPHGGDIVYASLPKKNLNLGSKRPYVLLSNNKIRSYIARSGLVLDGNASRIKFNVNQTEYRMAHDKNRLDVDLFAEFNGLEINKRISLERDSYAIDVNYYIKNNTENTVEARFIGQLARDNSPGTFDTLEIDIPPPLGAVYSTPDNKFKKVSFEDIQYDRVDDISAQGGWVAITQYYFLSAWVPPQSQENLFYATTDSSNRNVAAFAGEILNVAVDSQSHLGATLYVGPKEREYLKPVAPNLNLAENLCEKLLIDSAITMSMRQAGMPRSIVKNDKTKHPIFNLMIDKAFKTPIKSNDEDSNKLVNDFSRATYQACNTMREKGLI